MHMRKRNLKILILGVTIRCLKPSKMKRYATHAHKIYKQISENYSLIKSKKTLKFVLGTHFYFNSWMLALKTRAIFYRKVENRRLWTRMDRFQRSHLSLLGKRQGKVSWFFNWKRTSVWVSSLINLIARLVMFREIQIWSQPKFHLANEL